MSPAALTTPSVGCVGEAWLRVEVFVDERLSAACDTASLQPTQAKIPTAIAMLPRIRRGAIAGASVLGEVATARVSEAHHQVCSGPGHRYLLRVSERERSVLILARVVGHVVAPPGGHVLVYFRLGICRRVRFS